MARVTRSGRGRMRVAMTLAAVTLAFGSGCGSIAGDPNERATDSADTDSGPGKPDAAPQAGGTRCSAGECITTMATGQSNAWALALDQTHLYWTNQDPGSIVKMALDGGPPVTLASSQ